MSDKEAIDMEVGETWKPVRGYEGLYNVSSAGRVKSLARKTITMNRGVPERILTPNVMNGYCCVTLRKDNKVKVFRIHRLVAEAFIGEQPTTKHQINHIDGNKQNNSVCNLEWCTPRENTAHAYKTGLRKSAPTEETRKKLADGTRKRWESQEYREAQREMMANTWKRRKEAGWTGWKK